jgi:hypothetical protein
MVIDISSVRTRAAYPSFANGLISDKEKVKTRARGEERRRRIRERGNCETRFSNTVVDPPCSA